MRHQKKILGVLGALLAVLLVVAVALGIDHKEKGLFGNPTEAKAADPLRPGDPGVVEPLEDNRGIPEDGVVWDMENIVDDLFKGGWAEAQWASAEVWRDGNISLLGNDGKGYQESRALGIRQNGSYSWSDVYRLGIRKDDTACTHWGEGKMLWIWYDSGEMDVSMLLEISLNDQNMAAGYPYYVMEEGQETAYLGGNAPEAYPGAGYSRIPLRAKYQGWVGIPLEAYGESFRRVNAINVHLSYNGEAPVGKTLYLDNFCVTTEKQGPMGAELSEQNINLATSHKAAWDMENIPEDMVASKWATMVGAEWDSYKAGNIRVFGIDGKGVNESRALRVHQVGGYNGADVFSLNIAMDDRSYTDWSQGEMLWFWADTRELRNDINMDLSIDDKKLRIGSAYYGINLDKQIQSAGTAREAYTGAGYGRFTIGAGYCGWVGIPLGAYSGKIETVSGLTMHLAYSGNASNEDRNVYFDEFWVLKNGEMPKTATPGNIDALKGGNNGVNTDVGPAPTLPCEIWSMENLPNNLLDADWAFAPYASYDEYQPGNVQLLKALGKGYKGSAALEIRQNGSYSWIDTFDIDLSKDSTAIRNWAGGKILWIYADASEHTSKVNMDLTVDQVRLAKDAEYYLIADGEKVATRLKLAEAYTDAGFGRIGMTTGFRGWIGIPLSSFQQTVTRGSLLELHLAYSGNDEAGKSLYLDSFCLSADNTAPNGVVVKEPEPERKADSKSPAWDMEQVPSNLAAAGWAGARYEGNEAFTPGNVQFLGIDGAGRKGSRAIEVAFNGAYSWSDVYDLRLKADSTVATDWSAGELLWLWVDASDIQAELELELAIDGIKALSEAGYYQVNNGKAGKAGELIAAWDQSGRIPIEAGYVGFVGIPLSAYGRVGSVETVTVHFAGNGVQKNRRLYLDEIWVTGRNEVPVNAENGYIYEPDPGQEQERLPLEVWSMEGLPADLISAGLAEAKYAAEGAYQAGNVTITRAPGKGQGGSQALAVNQNGSYSWADVFQLYMSRDETADTNWNGAKMVWMWVDASGFATDISMDLYLDGRSLKIGQPYYKENGDGTASMAGRLPTAYDSATFGRLPISAGYQGYIGIPLSAFTSVPRIVNTIEVHLAYSDGTKAVGKTLYLDALTISDEKTGPGGMKILKAEDTSVAATADKAAWDMENLPGNLISDGLATTEWQGEADFVAGNVTLLGAAGKGRNRSKALQIKQNGSYSWTDEFVLNMTKAGGFADNWSQGDMMMLWVDASEYSSGTLNMEFDINDMRPKSDAGYYLERDGMLLKAGTLPDAWGGSAGWSRLTFPAGFQGWVGVPLSAYGAIHTVDTIKIHVAYSGGAETGKSLYLDDLWIFSGNAMPKGTATAKAGENTAIRNEGQPTSNQILTDVSGQNQQIAAYGISDAWWANAIGQRDNIGDIMKLFYTDSGIGLNQYRINVYGGVKEDHSDGPTYEPVWRAGYSPLGEDGAYSIQRNEGSYGAFTALKQLTASGEAQVDDYTLFMNTPPSTMTDNGLTYNNNKLKSDCYDAYAAYVADVVQLYEANGIHVRYVSPINEPTLAAWTGNAGQESCVYTIDQVISVYEKVIDALEARGLTTKLSLAEFNSWDNAERYFDRLLGNQKIAGHIDHYTAHDYGGSGSVKARVAGKAAGAGLKVHMSEWCMAISDKADNMDTALMLAKMLYEDQTILNTTSWSWWTGVAHGGYTDGLIYVTDNDTVIETTKRFWAYGNYTKFTKNLTRINVDSQNAPSGVYVTAYRSQEEEGQLVYVAINEGASSQMITLAGLPEGAKAKVYETSDAHNLDQIGYMKGACGYSLPARSVTTFVFEHVTYSQVKQEAGPSGYSEQIADMEHLPADLLADGKATSYFPNNVGAVSAEKQGLNQTGALGYVYKNLDGGNYWGNYIEVAGSELGMKKDWSGADRLWFWADGTDFCEGQNLEVRLNSACMPAGTTVYFWDGVNTPTESKLADAWNGTGRIVLPKGYKGFVGVPLSAYTLDSNAGAFAFDAQNVTSLYFYLEPRAEESMLPLTLYLDEFWLTDEDSLPGVQVKNPGHYKERIADMESLTGNLFDTTISDAWEAVAFNMWDSTNVGAVMEDGKGVNGSKAISYMIKDQSQAAWNDNIVLRLNWISGAWKNPCDMNSGDIFWFWANAEEFGQELTLEVRLAGADYNHVLPATGSIYYTWDGTSGEAQAQVMPEAYSGAGYGRVKLPENYKGFIGIPLRAWKTLDRSNVTQVMYYLSLPQGLDPGEKHLYLDEFWIVESGSLPGIMIH